MASGHGSFQWRYPIREMRRRPARSALALGGIVLGVAAVIAVTTSIQATRDAYAGLFRSLAGRASLEVVRAGGQGAFVPDLKVLERIPGVRAAVPLVQSPAGLVTPDGTVAVYVLGIDPESDASVRDYHLVAGTDLEGGTGVLLEANFATRHGYAVGRPARLITPKGPVALSVVGLLAARGPARFNGGAIAFLPLAKAQALFTAPGKVDAVHLLLEPGASREAIQAAIRERFPDLEARPPATGTGLAGEFLRSIEQPLESLSAVAVVAGALVVLNTFLINIGERQRQLSLLRALGATRRQITQLLLRQALLLGALGAAIGLPVGLLLAMGLLRLNESYLGIELPGFSVSAGVLILGAILGPGMSLIATVMPALQAARRPPLDGIRLRGGVAIEPQSRRPMLVGVGLLIVVLLFEVAVVYGWLPVRLATALLPGMAGGCLIGCALVLPLLLPSLLAVAARLAPLRGVEGRLAVRHLARQRSRTSLTVGVLFAALTAGIAFGTSFLNNLRDIRLWFRHTITSDFLVRAVHPDPAVVLAPAPIPATTYEEVRTLPGCDGVAAFRFLPVRVNGLEVLSIVREFPAREVLPLVLVEGDDDPRERLEAGEVVLGTAVARRLGVRVGDAIMLDTPSGPKPVRVAGIAKEYGAGGLALYLEWHAAARLFGSSELHGLTVNALPGSREDLEALLRDYCEAHGLVLQRNSDFADILHRVVAGVRALVAGLVALIFVVAALGVVNTLTTNVLDQTRELGVLRALGMKRGQLHKLVVFQALVLALVSSLPGVPAGLILAWLMNLATPELAGHQVPFRIEWWLTVGCVVGVTVLACLSALVPARRAARLAVIDAIHYE
jgi:putative ABC transport system permease protein